jgi:hypothetical protein
MFKKFTIPERIEFIVEREKERTVLAGRSLGAGRKY